MTSVQGVVWCLAWILGLLIANIPLAPALMLGCSLVGAGLMPRWWRLGPRPRTWAIAGLIGLVAIGYLRVRSPHPGPNDISQFIPNAASDPSLEYTVQGWVLNTPTVNRAGRARFRLRANYLSAKPLERGEPQGFEGSVEQPSSSAAQPLSRKVRGKVYVTAPLLQATGLYPGQLIQVTGSLYAPAPALNPNGFDFAKFLNRQGIFTGLSSQQIQFDETKNRPQWRWWQLRQHIVKAQVRSLGSPAGPLVSAMVLGRRAVDLPYGIRDAFVQVGLAHTLAASGFHVSLLLGTVLALTRRFAERTQAWVGGSVLVLYVGLTGLQPSVLRAAIMGSAILIGLLTQRRIKPLGALLVAAVLLLLGNPLWIADLGFQLSFLATLGLIVTVPPLMRRLDWLPPTLATLVAVPIAASIWILPLQLYVFGVASPYSIPVNILTTPLVVITSLGGMASALVALMWSQGGSFVALFLAPSVHLLMAIVNFCHQLPGSTLAVGTLALPQVLGVYGLYGLVWLHRWWKPRWALAAVMAFAVVMGPAAYAQSQLVQVTVLANTDSPVLVLQNRSQVMLVNSGNSETAFFTVQPFLQQAGINRIDWAIAPQIQSDALSGWQTLADKTDVSGVATIQDAPPLSFAADSQSLVLGKPTQLDDLPVQLLNADPPVLQFTVQTQPWLWVDRDPETPLTGTLSPHPILVWSGSELTDEFVQVVDPQIAIATLPPAQATRAQLQQYQIPLYETAIDGAIQWTPKQGFRSTLGTFAL